MSVAPRTALGATEFSPHNAKTAKAEKFRPEQVYNVQVTSTGLFDIGEARGPTIVPINVQLAN